MTRHRFRISSPLLLCGVIATAMSVACTTVDRSTSDSTASQQSTDAANAPMDSAAGTAGVPTPPAATGTWQMRTDGIEGVRVGMTTAQVRTAFGLPAAPPFAAGSCEYIPAASLPRRLYLMAVSDTLVRIDVRDSTVATAEGARVGDTEARIREIYGNAVREEPHKYTGPVGHYLKVTTPGDTTRMTVFETDGSRVTMYRVGRKPEVEYVEGCS
ncbi:MAG: hypothetical protein V4617_21860 [Gemmatimonadota bacterium]